MGNWYIHLRYKEGQRSGIRQAIELLEYYPFHEVMRRLKEKVDELEGQVTALRDEGKQRKVTQVGKANG